MGDKKKQVLSYIDTYTGGGKRSTGEFPNAAKRYLSNIYFFNPFLEKSNMDHSALKIAI